MQFYSKSQLFLRLIRNEIDFSSSALNENQYNHVTATYYLLAEKILHTQQQSEVDEDGRNPKRRRHLQPASEPFTEQIGVFVSSASK